MKKIINIFLIVAITMTQSLVADNWTLGGSNNNDLLDQAVKNLTTVKTYIEEDGTTNMYSGSFSIRFDSGNEFDEPLFSFTPPTLEVGCNGIDFKGMFMSLLGLDQLGDMLQNAGTTLAWGVAVGLIYSLPGVASAFKFINQWAKKIQALLADACNAGIQIGMWIGETTGVSDFGKDSEVLKWLNNLGPKEVAAGKQRPKSILLDALGLSDTFATSTGEMDGDEKQRLIVAMFRGIFESDASTLGSMMSSIGLSVQNGGTKDMLEQKLGITELGSVPGNVNGGDSSVSKAVTIKKFAISRDGTEGLTSATLAHTFSISEMAKIATSTNSGAPASLTRKSKAKLGVFSYILEFNYVGDIGLTMPGEAAMNGLYDIVKSNQNESNKTQAKEQLDRVKKTKNADLKLIGPGAYGSIPDNGRMLAEFIWYGIKDLSDASQSATARLKARKNKNIKSPIGTMVVLRDEAAGSTTSYIPLLAIIDNAKSSGLPNYYSAGGEYRGTLTESRCIVDQLVDGNGTLMSGNDDEVNYSGCKNNGLVYPEIHKYIKIIKDSPSDRKYPLKQLLVQVMATKMAEAILGAMDEHISMVRTTSALKIPSSSGGTAKGVGNSGVDAVVKSHAKLMVSFRNRQGDIVQTAYKALEKVLAEGNTKKGTMESTFAKQDLVNRARGLRTLQK